MYLVSINYKLWTTHMQPAITEHRPVGSEKPEESGRRGETVKQYSPDLPRLEPLPFEVSAIPVADIPGHTVELAGKQLDRMLPELLWNVLLRNTVWCQGVHCTSQLADSWTWCHSIPHWTLMYWFDSSTCDFAKHCIDMTSIHLYAAIILYDAIYVWRLRSVICMNGCTTNIVF